MPSVIIIRAQSAPSTTSVTSDKEKESEPEVAHATAPPTNNEREKSKNESDENQIMPSLLGTNKDDENLNNESDGEQPKHRKVIHQPVASPVTLNLEHHSVHLPSNVRSSLSRELPQRTENQTRHPAFSQRGRPLSLPLLHSPNSAHTNVGRNAVREEATGKRKRPSTKKNILGNERYWPSGTGRVGKKLRSANPQPIVHPAIAHHRPTRNPPMMHYHSTVTQMMIPHPWMSPRQHVPAHGAQTSGKKSVPRIDPAYVHPTPQGRSQLVKLTLPPPNVSLGILLYTCTVFGLPELIRVEKNSPMSHQIPKDFHMNCCILSLESEAIGYVEPKTAHQCITLIAASREECGSQLKMMLAQKSNTGVQPKSRQGMNVLTESKRDHVHPLPQGRSRLVQLTLPPPNVSLGILLDTCTTFGLPELKDVDTTSPMEHQIPRDFQKNCYILSLESQAIGHVQPKTAQQCATLIATSRDACESEVKIVLMQKSNIEAQPRLPQGAQLLPEPMGARIHPIPQGKSQLVKFMLPPPNVSLGILLNTCSTYGLPELKDVEKNSPMNPQIPPEFRSNCYILSLESPAIGYVEPKTAHQCAKLIVTCQKERERQMKVMFVQKSNTETKPNLPQRVTVPAQSRGDHLHDAPQGKSQLVKLMLPPPNVSLGILLNTCSTYGLPELKDVEKNSPMNPQIPPEFRSNCYILSLESPAIGYVEPKTAHQCASLIATCQKERGSQLKVVLVQKSKHEAQPDLGGAHKIKNEKTGLLLLGTDVEGCLRAVRAPVMKAPERGRSITILAQSTKDHENPTPEGKTLMVKLTLPPQNVKLGILLGTCSKFGLPELKDVDIKSPINSQIPRDFQKSCCILSIESQANGYVEPKTAQECASLIATCREECGSQVKILLVQKSKIKAATNPPHDKQVTEPTGGA